jgi:hypothetical protein
MHARFAKRSFFPPQPNIIGSVRSPFASRRPSPPAHRSRATAPWCGSTRWGPPCVSVRLAAFRLGSHSGAHLGELANSRGRARPVSRRSSVQGAARGAAPRAGGWARCIVRGRRQCLISICSRVHRIRVNASYVGICFCMFSLLLIRLIALIESKRLNREYVDLGTDF